MQNVLHLINYLGSGGSEIYIYSLAKRLHNKKCNFHIAYAKEGKGLNMFNELGINLIKFDMNGPFDIKAARELKSLCRELSIDVIHTHFLRENYISILSKLLNNKVKIINTRHMLFNNSASVILANRYLTKLNDKIIAVSSAVKEQLISEKISHKKIELIYTGVDIQEWSTSTPSTFRDEFNIPDDELLITSVARFTEEKGHTFFIESIKYFKDYIKENNISTSKFKFVLVGDGELHNSIIEKTIELDLQDDIIFTGFRRDIKNILKSSNIFVAHSSNEAFGISILEAMAVGLPVITTDSGGTREIINDIFNNGKLINYGDKVQLAEGLLDLMNNDDLRDRFISNGFSTIQNHFDLDNTAKETYNLYRMDCNSEPTID